MVRNKKFRIKQKERIIKSRLSLCRQIKYSLDEDIIELNRLSKKHPLDCGKANCQMCRRDDKQMNKKNKLKLPLEDSSNE